MQIVDRRASSRRFRASCWRLGLPGLFLVWRRSRLEGCGSDRLLRRRAFLGLPGRGSRVRSISCSPAGKPTPATRALAVAGGADLTSCSGGFAPARAAWTTSIAGSWLVLPGRHSHAGSLVSRSGRLACTRVRLVDGGFASIDPLRRAREPFLSSRPSPRLLWVVDRVRRHVQPGERLLYEEGGFGLPGVPDPFQGGRFSGLLPERTGVEVIGGPYLHASLKTNFTQFGEGKLFGKADWDRAYFVRYAKLYRPSAILCWSPHARRFCSENPDLVKVLEDDGTVLIGRVKGFEGDFIEGTGTSRGVAGRIRVQRPVPRT